MPDLTCRENAFAWLVTLKREQQVEAACRWAESVLHAWEEAYPDDMRPRQAIVAARLGPAQAAQAADAADLAAALVGTHERPTAMLAADAAARTARAAASPSDQDFWTVDLAARAADAAAQASSWTSIARIAQHYELEVDFAPISQGDPSIGSDDELCMSISTPIPIWERPTDNLSTLHDHLDEYPDDWDARLVLADLMEEHDDHVGAEGQRWQAAKRKHPVDTGGISWHPVIEHRTLMGEQCQLDEWLQLFNRRHPLETDRWGSCVEFSNRRDAERALAERIHELIQKESRGDS